MINPFTGKMKYKIINRVRKAVNCNIDQHSKCAIYIIFWDLLEDEVKPIVSITIIVFQQHVFCMFRLLRAMLLF